MVESLCLQTETGSTQTAEEQVTSGETMNGWIQLAYWQMDWLSICLGNSFLLTGSEEKKKVVWEDTEERTTKRLEVVRVSDHKYTHMYEHVAHSLERVIKTLHGHKDAALAHGQSFYSLGSMKGHCERPGLFPRTDQAWCTCQNHSPSEENLTTTGLKG